MWYSTELHFCIYSYYRYFRVNLLEKSQKKDTILLIMKKTSYSKKLLAQVKKLETKINELEKQNKYGSVFMKKINNKKYLTFLAIPLVTLAVLFLVSTILNLLSESSTAYTLEENPYLYGYEYAAEHGMENFDNFEKDCGRLLKGYAEAVSGCNSYIKEQMNYSKKSTEKKFIKQGFYCSDDCSGHQAGYEWARGKDIESVWDCGGKSNSFIEGCKTYVYEK